MVSGRESSRLFDDLLLPRIFQAFRMSIQPTKLLIALSALAIICLAGWLMDKGKTVVGRGDGVTELQIYMTSPSLLQHFIETNKELTDERRGVFSTLWDFAAERFHGAVDSVFVFDVRGVGQNIIGYFRAIGWALKHHSVYCIVFMIITLAVISVAGGAVCRIAALQFARGEKPGLTEAVRFSIKRLASFFAAPLAPVGIIVFVGLFVFLLGLIGNIPWAGELIIGVFMLLAVIAGALMAVILIGAVAGLNLMFPAVAYDGSDCFDAISRSFSYVYAKPWRMVFYSAVAAAYGSICYTFVRLFAFLLLWITHLSLRLGVWSNERLTAIWQEPDWKQLLFRPNWEALNWPQSIAAFLVYLCVLAVVGLLVSFIMSFFFSANTIIYALMRKKVDNTALEDIYIHFDESETGPTTVEPPSEEAKPQSESQPDSSA